MWKLIEDSTGDITNGEVIDLYKCISCSASEKLQGLAKKIEVQYQNALDEKIQIAVLEDEGGIVLEKQPVSGG